MIIDRDLNYGRHLIAKFIANSTPAQRIMDLGAGRGYDLLIAKSKFPDAELIAIEVYKPYIENLQHMGAVVQSLDIERDILPYEDNSIDIIIANQILEHVKDIFWIFHEVTRVLKTGGSFIIGVPNLAAFHNRLLLLLGNQPSPLKNRSAHVRGWTRSDMLDFLQHCFPNGYQTKGFGGSNFYPFPRFIAKPLANLFPGLAWSFFFHFQKIKEYKSEFIEYPVNQQLETNFYVGK